MVFFLSTPTMELHRPRPATFQARVTQLLKKLNWRARLAGRHSKDDMSVVSSNTHPLPPSPDVLRKPDMSSPLAAFRLASIPTDTDDSSSSNSPTRQSRRYSAWDGLTQSPVSPVFAAHGPAPLFLREITTPDVAAIDPACDEGKVLAPAPLFLLAGTSSDRLTQTTNIRRWRDHKCHDQTKNSFLLTNRLRTQTRPTHSFNQNPLEHTLHPLF
ncbi:hypothetical protein M405DRAFT_278927 [Rhizopogon salebrosus TDB-379]|nr:hypothetical protein M405DRAFT_278927 [Rhizopogon salebrosus TDB-379]